MFKTFIAAAATALTLGTAASADGFFSLQSTFDAGSVVELGTVSATGPATVEIFDYHRGEIGALLGTEMLNAGANANVRVDVGRTPIHDVIAVLTVDGQVVDTQELDIR